MCHGVAKTMPTPKQERDSRYNARRQWQHLYSDKRWRNPVFGRSPRQLRKDPLCVRCKAQGKVVIAKIANHIVPHKGDEKLFFSGELESVCKACHDGPIQREEIKGYSDAVDVFGFPTDPLHPFNRT